LPLSSNSKGEEKVGWKMDFSHLAISISVKNGNPSAISWLDLDKPISRKKLYEIHVLFEIR
jgi:hypothetical protein